MATCETIMPHELNTLERALELSEASEGSVLVPCRHLRVLMDYHQDRDAVIANLEEEIEQLESKVEELRSGSDEDDDDEPEKPVGARAMVVPGKIKVPSVGVTKAKARA